MIPSCLPGQPCIDVDAAAPALPGAEEGALCSSWLSQPSPSSLQPLTQWTTYPDYVSHEAASCPYTADMYIQPMCPSYTLVGPSSVLTYASQPLITNFTVSQRYLCINDGKFPTFQKTSMRSAGYNSYNLIIITQLILAHSSHSVAPSELRWALECFEVALRLEAPLPFLSALLQHCGQLCIIRQYCLQRRNVNGERSAYCCHWLQLEEGFFILDLQ